MAIKINLMIAFDMVKWKLVLGVIIAINTPYFLVDKINQCITTLRFSVNFNGKQVSYFDSTNELL